MSLILRVGLAYCQRGSGCVGGCQRHERNIHRGCYYQSTQGVLAVGDGTHTGTVILTGHNTFSGGTVVQSGTLLVDNAAALGTGNVNVNGGALATEVRPINVLGNYTQNAGGTLQLRVAGAKVGQYDTLNVRGNATVGGTLQVLSLGFAPAAGNAFGLVTTGGTVSGSFAQFLDPFVVGPAFNTIDLVYGLNSVVLKFLNTSQPISPVVPIVPTGPISRRCLDDRLSIVRAQRDDQPKGLFTLVKPGGT